MNLDKLIRKSWRIYDEVVTKDFIVSPSIPILFFGDSNRYFHSKIRIVTVGLNPSKTEFPEDERFQRFPDAQGIYAEILHGKHFDKYLSALNNYFRESPYERWFSAYEPVLNGLESSYYGLYRNVALHTDLCSPLATDPTWTRLTSNQKVKLEPEGNKIWRCLISTLCPDLLVVSISKKYLEKMEIIENWKTLCTVKRKNPYKVRLSKMRINDEMNSAIVFGRAANTPFGTVSNKDKSRIGSLIRRYYSW